MVWVGLSDMESDGLLSQSTYPLALLKVSLKKL
jgi:hypothetical protein